MVLARDPRTLTSSEGRQQSHQTPESKSEGILPAQPQAPVKSFPRINRNGRVQDRIVIFPHLLLKDSGDIYPFPMQRITDGDGDGEGEHVNQHTNQVVAILIDHMYFCGGVVLDASTVLTAAHCTDGAQSFRIISPPEYIAGRTARRVYTATRHEEHPDWSPLTLEADLAKIYLHEELEVINMCRAQDKTPA